MQYPSPQTIHLVALRNWHRAHAVSMFAHTCGVCGWNEAASGMCVGGLHSAPVAKVLTTLAICVRLSTCTSGVALPATDGRGAIIGMVNPLRVALVSTPMAPLSLRLTGVCLLGSCLRTGVGKTTGLLSSVRSIASADAVCASVVLTVLALPDLVPTVVDTRDDTERELLADDPLLPADVST
jgi:hypothetical protein